MPTNCSDRKHNNGFQGGWEQGGQEQQGESLKSHEDSGGAYGCGHYFGRDDGFLDVPKHVKLHTLNMCSLLYVNYTR